MCVSLLPDFFFCHGKRINNPHFSIFAIDLRKGSYISISLHISVINEFLTSWRRKGEKKTMGDGPDAPKLREKGNALYKEGKLNEG